jgi:hypothetical protein
MITTKDCIVSGIIGITIMGGMAIRECGKVSSIPRSSGCHDSVVVAPASTKVVCDDGAKQTVEFWTGGNGVDLPMTVKCRCD